MPVSTNRVTGGVISAADINGIATLLNSTETTANAAVPASQKGAVNGVASLDATGKVPSAQLPAGSTPDATTSTNGVVRLAGDLGGTAAAPTTPTAVHLTGAETITGAKTFTVAPVVPDSSFTIAKLNAAGARDTTTFLRGDGSFAAPVGSGTAVTRTYIDGVMRTGTLPAVGSSILDAALRVADTATLRLFEIRLGTAPAGGSMTFQLRKNGTAVTTLTIAAGATSARVDPTTSFAEGDLLDIFLSANSATTPTSVTISGTVDSRENAPATGGTVSNPATALIVDNFDRANSTTTLGSTSTGALPWTANSGTWGVISNQAYNVNKTDATVATIDTSRVNMAVSATTTVVANGYWGLVVAFQDTSNFFWVEIQPDGGMLFYRREGGVNSAAIVSANAGTFVTGDVVKVERFNANQFQIFKNGASVIATNTSQTQFPTATRAGMRYGTNGAAELRWDNFTVAAV